MGIKKEKKEMVLPPPGRPAHDERCFLRSVVSVGPLLPPRPTCRDLLAACSVFPSLGLIGEATEKTAFTVGLGTQSLGVRPRRTRVRGRPRTSLRQAILPFLVYRETGVWG